jgi:AraC family ethanolamine operon transcriptional activator
MQNPQPLPIRSTVLETVDVDELAAAQPERRRRYEQLHRGSLHGKLIEESWGSAALMRERWSCGVRVRCDRPGGYVAYGVLTWHEGDVSLCGAALAPRALVRVVEPWELSSSGPVELLCFGVERAALEAVAAQLAEGEPPRPPGNRWGAAADDGRLAGRLLHLLRLLDTAGSEPAALAGVEGELLRLAAGLDRAVYLAPVERMPHFSRRRAAVRRVEEYLDACGDEVPTIPTLCAVAGVSERTLEYAFREQLGTTPVRFLKLRRLNRVRRDLLAAAPGTSVTGTALRAGVYDLGRFAGEYQRLFGELPSQTLRRATAGNRPPRRIQSPSGYSRLASGHRAMGRAFRPARSAPR